MTQMTIELDDDLLRKIQDSASRENLPPNRWLARMIRHMFQDKSMQLEAIRESAIERGWPEDIVDSAGAWPDFPSLEEIRGDVVEDAPREPW